MKPLATQGRNHHAENLCGDSKKELISRAVLRN